MDFGVGDIEGMEALDTCVCMVPLMPTINYNGGRTSHPNWDRKRLFNIFLKQPLLDGRSKNLIQQLNGWDIQRINWGTPLGT